MKNNKLYRSDIDVTWDSVGFIGVDMFNEGCQ